MSTPQNSNKDTVLVVLPYGMCFRAVVLNKSLWSFLTQKYEVDVMTPLKVTAQVRKDYGIRNILPFRSPKKHLAIVQSIAHRLLHWWKFCDLAHFLFMGDLGENYALRYRWATPGLRRQMLFFAALNNTIFTRLFKFLFNNAILSLYPTSFYIQENRYKFVLVSHVSESECVLTSIIAEKFGISVITSTLGMDNYMHGLLPFAPDLMLLWGEEQAYEFNQFHLPLNKELSKTKYEIVGSPSYDNYLEISNDSSKCSKEIFQKILGPAQSNDDIEIILFPAFVEYCNPGQTALTELIVKFIKENSAQIKLLIRVRPNIDEEMWKTFQKKHSENVILQIPQGASYDKSGYRSTFEPEKEQKEMEVFVNTVKYSTLLINPSPSTMIYDSILLDTPSVYALFNWDEKIATRKAIPHQQQKFYLGKSLTYPQRKGFNVIYNKEDFARFLHGFFILKERNGYISKELLKIVATDSADGCSGERTVHAIENFFGSNSGKKSKSENIRITARQKSESQP